MPSLSPRRGYLALEARLLAAELKKQRAGCKQAWQGAEAWGKRKLGERAAASSGLQAALDKFLSVEALWIAAFLPGWMGSQQ